ncbi:bacteriorhodopsin [Halorientalis sp.]|jgi:sensory rhodopsin|uniref:bacteriorhodopsin n=1 Tax=Halorientalis sp. TaxID=1931229 RepID=UPI002604EEE3|nr:bacteriorhodopsin [Halorientalis sp.]
MTEITTWFQLGTLGLIGGTLAMGYAMWRVPGENAREDWLLIGVGAIAAVAYALLSTEILTIQAADGHTVYLVRYIDWLVTTPMHVAYLALLVGVTGRYLWEVSVVQAATIALGLGGSMADGPLKWLLFGAGSLGFLRVLYVLYGPVSDAARAKTEAVAGTYRTLLNFIAVLWLIYPVVWLLAQSGLNFLDLETQALVISYIDVAAKVGFGLIALNGRAVASLVTDTEPEAGEPSAAD